MIISYRRYQDNDISDSDGRQAKLVWTADRKKLVFGMATDVADMRERVLAAAAAIVAEGGAEALTTRAIATAAATQGPTIYRLFGDKRGLLDALAEKAMADYVSAKQSVHAADDADPVAALRQAWHVHISFGLAHPALYHLMSASARGGTPAPAALAGMEILRMRVRRVADAGRLKVTEARAVAMIHAAGSGTVTALLEQGVGRDRGLSEAICDAVVAAITSDPSPPEMSDTPRLAITLRSRIKEEGRLSPGERLLLEELLVRLSGG